MADHPGIVPPSAPVGRHSTNHRPIKEAFDAGYPRGWYVYSCGRSHQWPPRRAFHWAGGPLRTRPKRPRPRRSADVQGRRSNVPERLVTRALLHNGGRDQAFLHPVTVLLAAIA